MAFWLEGINTLYSIILLIKNQNSKNTFSLSQNVNQFLKSIFQMIFQYCRASYSLHKVDKLIANHKQQLNQMKLRVSTQLFPMSFFIPKYGI